MQKFQKCYFKTYLDLWKAVKNGTKPFHLTTSNSRQSCLCSAWKPRGASAKKWCRGREPRYWLPDGTKPAPRILTQGNEVGHTERQWLRRWSFSLQDSLGQLCYEGLKNGSQRAAHKQGGWVGCVVIDCPWLIENKACAFSWKSGRLKCCVEIDPVFINPDIIIHKTINIQYCVKRMQTNCTEIVYRHVTIPKLCFILWKKIHRTTELHL